MADVMFCGILNITGNRHVTSQCIRVVTIILWISKTALHKSINKKGLPYIQKNWNMLSHILFVTISWASDMTVPPATAQTLQEIKNAFIV